jgi:site-specific recombinase XerC
MIIDDTHDLLTKAYMEYFVENEKFERKLSHRTHASSRRSLRKIITLAKQRQKEIHEKYAIEKQIKRQRVRERNSKASL